MDACHANHYHYQSALLAVHVHDTEPEESQVWLEVIYAEIMG